MLNFNPDSLSSEQVASPVTTGASAQILAGAATGTDPGQPEYRNGLLLWAPSTNTAPVFILLGPGAASATNYHIALSAGQSFGMGALGTPGGCWRGSVQAFSAAAQSLGVAVV